MSKDVSQDGHEMWRSFLDNVIRISLKRKLIKDVYSEKGIEIIKQTHNNWFAHVQRILIDDLILSIMRLFDPDYTGKYANFSLKYILKNASECIDHAHHQQINELVMETDKTIQKIKAHRDKRIAHADLSSVHDPVQLPSINFQEIESAIYTLSRIANIYSLHSGNGEIQFDDPIDPRSGELVISCLELGVSSYSLINLVNKIKYQQEDYLSHDEAKIKPLILKIERMGYRPRSD